VTDRDGALRFVAKWRIPAWKIPASLRPEKWEDAVDKVLAK
jgi:hypothetical protein